MDGNSGGRFQLFFRGSDGNVERRSHVRTAEGGNEVRRSMWFYRRVGQAGSGGGDTDGEHIGPCCIKSTKRDFVVQIGSDTYQKTKKLTTTRKTKNCVRNECFRTQIGGTMCACCTAFQIQRGRMKSTAANVAVDKRDIAIITNTNQQWDTSGTQAGDRTRTNGRCRGRGEPPDEPATIGLGSGDDGAMACDAD